MDILMYIIKLTVYILLVTISGYVLVDSLIRNAVSEQRQSWANRMLQQGAKVLLLAVIVALFVQLVSWTQQFKPEASQLVTLLMEGTTGKVWLALIICSALLMLLVTRSAIARLLLVLAMLFAESMNGHASGDSIRVLFDFIHLATVSIWIGGAICLWLNWREGKEQAIHFIQRFSKLLWLSIAVVSISGVILTLLIMPSISYLLYTSWGQMLLLKLAAVLLALWLGYKAKTTLQKHNGAKLKPLAAELIVLAFVIAFAALVSSLSPVPSAANALNHHEMGEELHYTVKLTPNAPGPNRLSLSLWTLEEEGKVEQVQLSIYAADKPKTSERQFILEPAELEDYFEFPGFIETRYKFEKLNLPYPADWEATFTITFENGTERQISFQFEN